MRPIELTIQGLHSFRDKQVVDFKTLSEVGVFGIFGPTGSGKSSLLDAMTLALYGKVERAPNNTQGIINHAEDTLSVSFTFEIGREGTRYKVERMYRRTGEVTVGSTLSRLLQLTPEETILADKDRDVTAMVQQLLGLTIDDFTRAVVLPQGKFAEFLFLRGAERRKMLERLFHLEKYGEQLNRRLKTRLDEQTGKLHELESLQLELGNADRDEVTKAETEVEEAEQYLLAKKAALKQSEERYDEQKQIWEWQLEMRIVAEKKSTLQTQKADIDCLEKALHKAKEARRLHRYVADVQSAEEAVARCEQELQALTKNLHITEKEYDQAFQVYEQKKRIHDEQMPILIQEIEKYKYAKRIENEWKAVKSEVEELENAWQELETRRQETEKTLARKRAKLQRDEKLQANLETEIRAYAVTSKERLTVQNALAQKRTIDVLHEQCQRAVAELKRKEEQMAKQEDEYRRLLNKQHAHEQHGVRLFRKLETLYHSVIDGKTLLGNYEQKVTQQKIKEENKLEDVRRHELARELHRNLQPGDMCPVCGSTTHPKEFIFPESSSEQREKIEENITAFSHTLDFIKETQYTMKLYETKLSQLSSMIHDYVSELPEQKMVHSPTVHHIKEESLHAIERQVREHVQLLQQDVIDIEELTKHYVETYSHLRQQVLTAHAERQVNKSSIQELTETVQEANKNYDSARHEWTITFPDRSLNTIERDQEIINEKDKKTTELSERLENSVPYLEKSRAHVDTLANELHQLHVQVEGVASTLREKRTEMEKHQAELAKLLINRSASHELQLAEQQLEQLQTDVQTTYDQLTTLEEKKQTLENETLITTERYAQLMKNRQAATKRWQEQLEHSGFTSREQIEAAIVDPATEEEWIATIQHFTEEWNAVHYDYERLSTKLHKQTITEEQWKDTKATLVKAKDSYSKAIELKSKAEERLREIKQRHERFMELEQERLIVQKRVNEYRKLEQVFRGNAFVEFLAEEQLRQVTRDASVRLSDLTAGRYAIEVNSEGGFLIRDDANGGIKRPVTTLSGGETFLTSLALALSLSSHIQLRGKHPLEFFFLDEGFGTLDKELLETVITALEKLHLHQLSVGIISHVPELQARLTRKLIVHGEQPTGVGSRVALSM